MGLPRVRKAPAFRWTLADYGSRAMSKVGLELSSDAAKGALLKAIREAGGLRGSMTGTVHRPSGGGWFARQDQRGHLTWEAWGD